MKVLFVEDDPAFAQIFSDLLHQEDSPRFEITNVNSLSEARRQVADNTFDVMVLDMSTLADASMEALRSIRVDFPQLPLVLLIEEQQSKSLLDALTFGVQDYLPKGRLTGGFLPLALQGAVERGHQQVYLLSNAAVTVMEQKQDLVAMLAHDLKGPISGVNRALQLLLKGSAGELTDHQRTLVSKVQISNARLLKIVGNLLDVFRYDHPQRPDESEMTPIDLVVLLRGCVADIAQAAEDCQLHVDCDLPRQPVSILGYESAIQRLFLNLLDNAVKFTQNGGTITVILEANQESVWVWVKDTGLGIDQADLDKVFKRFWQGRPGKNYLGGTGLGLYLCRRIVEEYGGEITCMSSLGEGTTFGVRLPLHT